jgi:hypothetical protein
LSASDLAVEDAEHVALEAPLAVLVEGRQDRPDRLLERLPVLRPAVAAADGVDAQFPRGHADGLQDLGEEHHGLGVDQRVGRSDRLDADLGELPVAAFLGPLLAEGGPEVPHLPEVLLREEPLLDQRPDRPGRQLGPQRVGALLVVRIAEGEHLLLDDVGRLAARLVEERGVLEDRRADLLVAESRERLARGLLQPVPETTWSGVMSRVPSGA